MISPSTRNGFTLIEVLMVILLLGVLSIAGLSVLGPNIDETRFNQTVQRMRKLQVAMAGDPAILENNVRTSFGYLGDIGALPAGIAGLVTNPSLPAYSPNAGVRIGLGWNGPYASGENAAADYLVDAWGTAFVYSPNATPPTLVSLGADRAAGGSGFAQDITVSFPAEQRLATVSGFICNRGAPFTSAAEVELNYPNGAGALTQSLVTLTAASAGQFSYTNVPFGLRSLTIYLPSKAAPTSTIGPVVITVDKPNYLVPCNAIDVNP